jgi:hypothetical protein
MIGQVVEGSAKPVTVEVRDGEGAPVTPTSLQYSVYCLTTGTVVQDWTTVPGPATSNDFNIPGSTNVIQDQANPWEDKMVQVRINQGDDNVIQYNLAKYRVKKRLPVSYTDDY